MRGISKDDIARFLARFEQVAEGCWIWTGQVRESGYGVMRFGYSHIRAHRFSYRHFVNGDIPDDMVVRHSCHNKLCVNPKHLTLGSNLQNTHDMIDAQRHPTARTAITDEQVREIARLRRSGVSCRKIAVQLGLNYNGVYSIVRGRCRQAIYLAPPLPMASAEEGEA